MDFYLSYDRDLGFNKSMSSGSSTSAAKEYIVQSPQGDIYYITNLMEFCRRRGFPTASSLHQVAIGHVNQYKGWLCRRMTDSIQDWQKLKKCQIKRGHGWQGNYKIYYVDGTTETVKYISRFCKENKLKSSLIYKIINKQSNLVYNIIKIEKIDCQTTNWTA